MSAKIKKPYGHNYNPFRGKPRNTHPKAFKSVYYPYLPIALLFSFVLVAAAQTGGIGRFVNQSHSQVLGYSTDISDSALLSGTNSLRTAENLPDLQLNSKLDKAAAVKARDMAKRDYWSHNTPDGKSPWSFVIAQNYQYQKLGENLAAGFADSGSVIKAWEASASHRQNMLDPTYTSVGFGVANIANYKAAGGGPMTIVVAYYGQPTGAKSAAAPLANSGTPPATNLSDTANSDLKTRTSRAQIAFAKTPLSSIASSIFIVALLGALGIWLGRHFIGIRRAWMKGERFVIKHPAVDLFLLAVIALSFILSQTAGFIQ